MSKSTKHTTDKRSKQLVLEAYDYLRFRNTTSAKISLIWGASLTHLSEANLAHAICYSKIGQALFEVLNEDSQHDANTEVGLRPNSGADELLPKIKFNDVHGCLLNASSDKLVFQLTWKPAELRDFIKASIFPLYLAERLTSWYILTLIRDNPRFFEPDWDAGTPEEDGLNFKFKVLKEKRKATKQKSAKAKSVKDFPSKEIAAALPTDKRAILIGAAIMLLKVGYNVEHKQAAWDAFEEVISEVLSNAPLSDRLKKTVADVLSAAT